MTYICFAQQFNIHVFPTYTRAYYYLSPNCISPTQCIKHLRVFINHHRYDVRGKSHKDARHWSDDRTLAGRAFFRGDQRPARLVLDNIRDDDRAVYKCRVDYDRAPTRISNVALDIIGE